ncbi:hypothetical protein [Paenibacillus sp. YYML68]|uniref:hypothetical protein n=1 Tax=Paenibacillus sp. YYML68 TaxID=2909250 RepID=UPI002490D0E8|nr:hypothetical protein [Paenibacillus sp. YYML68]
MNQRYRPMVRPEGVRPLQLQASQSVLHLQHTVNDWEEKLRPRDVHTTPMSWLTTTQSV